MTKSWANMAPMARARLHWDLLAVRHQLHVLERTRSVRVRLYPLDRWLWVWLSPVWLDWRRALIIVEPATFIAWHRRGLRLFWNWKSRHRTGLRREPWLVEPTHHDYRFRFPLSRDWVQSSSTLRLRKDCERLLASTGRVLVGEQAQSLRLIAFPENGRRSGPNLSPGTRLRPHEIASRIVAGTHPC
jgi:hypothetical protein